MLSIERQTAAIEGFDEDIHSVRQWFDHVYTEKGRDYLRAPQAYEIFLALLGVEPQTRLLDVACGPGQLLSLLPSKEVEGYGVDISQAALRLLRASDQGSAVQQADACRLPYRDGTFDYITCIGSLERMLDLNATLRELRRVARDGARFCFMVRNSRTLTWSLIRRLGLDNAQAHQDAASLEEWSRRFDEAGFRVVRVVGDQWRMMLGERLRHRLGLSARFDEARRGVIPLQYVNEFVFVLERRGEARAHTAGGGGGRESAAIASRPLTSERRSLARFYDALSRFEFWRRRSRNLFDFTMHKGLSAPIPGRDGEPDEGPQALDDWFAARVAEGAPQSVLDIGCGFGATLQRVHARCGTTCHGLTLSSYQRAVFEDLADPSATHAFRIEVGDFETHPVDDYDAIMSLETLVYARDLDAAVARLAQSLREHGRLYLLEDMLESEPGSDDHDLESYQRLWDLARVYSRRQFEGALLRAGLEIVQHVDLTGRVVSTPQANISRRIRTRERLHRLALWEPLRHLSAAFLGGLHLESLYSRGLMGYHYYELTRGRGGTA